MNDERWSPLASLIFLFVVNAFLWTGIIEICRLLSRFI